MSAETVNFKISVDEKTGALEAAGAATTEIDLTAVQTHLLFGRTCANCKVKMGGDSGVVSVDEKWPHFLKDKNGKLIRNPRCRLIGRKFSVKIVAQRPLHEILYGGGEYRP